MCDMLVYLKNGCWLKRCPRAEDSFHMFSVDESIFPTLQDAKKFCRTVVTSGDSLVHMRNQLTFLLTDLYGEGHSSHFDIPFEKATIFWAWIFLPCSEGESEGGIMSHDLVYIKRDLTEKEIKKVQSTLRQLNMNVFARKVPDAKSVCEAVVPARRP